MGAAQLTSGPPSRVAEELRPLVGNLSPASKRVRLFTTLKNELTSWRRVNIGRALLLGSPCESTSIAIVSLLFTIDRGTMNLIVGRGLENGV